MTAILRMAFSNAFTWMKTFEFQIKFHWNMFLGLQLTINQYWFRKWLGLIHKSIPELMLTSCNLLYDISRRQWVYWTWKCRSIKVTRPHCDNNSSACSFQDPSKSQYWNIILPVQFWQWIIITDIFFFQNSNSVANMIFILKYLPLSW